MLRDFKKFALKGNVIDLAVAVIIGAAFTKVVNALSEGVLMPLVSAVIGQPNFDKLLVTIGDAQIQYGTFLTALVNFLIVALAMFFVVRFAHKLMSPKKDDTGPPVAKECPYCITSVPVEATRCPSCTSELSKSI